MHITSNLSEAIPLKWQRPVVFLHVSLEKNARVDVSECVRFWEFKLSYCVKSH